MDGREASGVGDQGQCIRAYGDERAPKAIIGRLPTLSDRCPETVGETSMATPPTAATLPTWQVACAASEWNRAWAK
ncbi:hypothetical protein ACIOHC_30940 [Streptomyces sp. NPDC088252]|uniref:hypothetical protein n=1 Tax=unclassified Streptomyces TaxID=2593676 RepID=UPI0038112408